MSRGLPITRIAFRRLEAEAERLAAEVPELQALAPEEGLSGDPGAATVLAMGGLHLAGQRLQTLRKVIADSRIVEPDGTAVVGSRIRVRHSDGEQEEYELVAPGEAAPRLGRISPDSPLGSSLLGRAAGEVVNVVTPDGEQPLTVVTVV
jgi:transcription elongation factor GreA